MFSSLSIVREKERPQLHPMLLRACSYQVSQRLSAEIEGRTKFFNEKKKKQFFARTTTSLDDSKIIQLSSNGKSRCKEICSPKFNETSISLTYTCWIDICNPLPCQINNALSLVGIQILRESWSFHLIAFYVKWWMKRYGQCLVLQLQRLADPYYDRRKFFHPIRKSWFCNSDFFFEKKPSVESLKIRGLCW